MSKPLPSSSSSSDSTTTQTVVQIKEEIVEASKQTVSSFRSLAAGGVGGVCAVLVGHPFDLVKVRMQTAEKGVYTGAIDVVKKTIAREGLRKVRHNAGGPEKPLLKALLGTLCWCFRALGRRDPNV